MATPKKPAAAAAAKKVVAANPELVLLTAIEPIRLNRKDIAPEDSFAADADTAEALLSSGAARIADVE